jgi:hypothetical protein
MVYDAVMARSDKAAEAAYQREWYMRPGNKARVRASAAARRVAIAAMIRAFKDKPCADCGVRYPHYVMDLDHREPSEKYIDPGNLPGRGWSDDRVMSELTKCDVVCANCHRTRTHR